MKKIKEWIVLRKFAKKLRESGNYCIVEDSTTRLQRKFKFLCGIIWSHVNMLNKLIAEDQGQKLICGICFKELN